MPDLYFNHLSRLVAGVRLLSAPSLSRDDLSTAETALVAFYDEFGDLYGMSILRIRYSTGSVAVSPLSLLLPSTI